MLVKFQNFTNNIIGNFHMIEGILHWVSQRLSVLLVLFCVSFSIFFDSLLVFLITLILLVLHINAGFSTLIDDYIHDEVLFLIGRSLLRMNILFLLKIIFVLSLC